MDHYQVFSQDELIAKMQAEQWQPKFVFFWGHTPKRPGQIGKWCFSQWYQSPFTLDGIVYQTAEHYFMAEKARLFNDTDALARIIEAPNPGAAKRFGRQVVGFDESTWIEHRVEIAIHANRAKFTQNEELQTYLLNTKNRVLVEASPRDKIWGIGLAEDDQRAENPEQWQGLNLLGFALMKVRTELLQE